MEEMSFYIKRILPESFYPLYIQYKYWRVFGRYCNLNKPLKYSEKIQWAKLHRRNELLTTLSDKVLVRKWVADRIGEEYLIPTIGKVYSKPEDICFGELPSKYVIKVNSGSGFNVIVNDSSTIDIEAIKKDLDRWLSYNYAFSLYELQYKNIEPKIIIEKNLMDNGIIDVPDYKFFCFGGKVFCSYTMSEYTNDHSKGKLGFFDREYNLLPYYRADYAPITEQMDKPKNYEKMVDLAETLAQGFSHVRVDLYNIKGKIYFGEMTFTNAGGFCRFVPEEFDLILGKQWNLQSGI